jgi:hypothetical protein
MVLQAEASYLDRGTFAVRLLPKFKEGDDEAKIVRGLQRIDELDLLLLEKTREGASPLPPRCAPANPHPSTPRLRAAWAVHSRGRCDARPERTRK